MTAVRIEPQPESYESTLSTRPLARAVSRCVSLFIENPSQSYRTSSAIWDHTVLPATWHRWTCRPASTL